MICALTLSLQKCIKPPETLGLEDQKINKARQKSLHLLCQMAKAEEVDPKVFKICKDRLIEQKNAKIKSIKKKYGASGILDNLHE